MQFFLLQTTSDLDAISNSLAISFNEMFDLTIWSIAAMVMLTLYGVLAWWVTSWHLNHIELELKRSDLQFSRYDDPNSFSFRNVNHLQRG